MGKWQPVNNINPPPGAGSPLDGEQNPESWVFVPCEVRAAVRVKRHRLHLFAVNIVSVSQSRSALHHLGSQYSRIRCIRKDAGHGCICSGCQEGVRGAIWTSSLNYEALMSDLGSSAHIVAVFLFYLKILRHFHCMTAPGHRDSKHGPDCWEGG